MEFDHINSSELKIIPGTQFLESLDSALVQQPCYPDPMTKGRIYAAARNRSQDVVTE